MTTARTFDRNFDFAKLAGITLDSGSHPDPDAGMCVMEAAAYIAGEPFSDHPRCVSEFITNLCIAFNDRLPSNAERDRYLKPLAAVADAVAVAAADNVHTAAFKAALAAASEWGTWWEKRTAAQAAARAVYEARFDEWELGVKLRAERDRSREQLVQLIEAMCEVGRAALVGT